MEKEYIERLVETEQRSKSNTKRLDKLENTTENIYELAMSTKELATEVKAMREELNKIDKRVLAIEDKPSKRMDQIISNILSALIGGIIGFILIQLGMK